MDRNELNRIKEDLESFIKLISQNGHGLDYACLIPAFEGDPKSPLILQVNAEWVKGMDCSDAIQLVVNSLFDSTSLETRQMIYRVDIYDEHGIWHCTSNEYVLIGQIPNVA